MEDINIRKTLSKNLIFLRKSRNLTQGQFAESINYSDKTVSKWENGDAIPDTETLYSISIFYGIKIDALLTENLQETYNKRKTTNHKQNVNKIIITALSVILVWLVAIVAYVQVRIVFDLNYWRIFIWAIPVTMILLLIFNAIWGKRLYTFIIISALVWTLLLALHLQLMKIADMWPIYFVGIPLQVATILWSQLKK